MQAIRDDAVAFGIGSVAGALAELLLIAIAVNILNRVALNQVKLLLLLLLFFLSTLCILKSINPSRLVAYANDF